jgi:hypothetical protein
MVPCELSSTDITVQATPSGVPVEVFLLCSGRLARVNRSVLVPDIGDEAKRRLLVAQGLLDALAGKPSGAEDEAGYSTAVPAGVRVSGARTGEPEDALRLSTAPDALPKYALAQLVCTFADSAAAEGDGSVVLGGPGDGSLRRYECTAEVQSSPGDEKPPSSEVGGS